MKRLSRRAVLTGLGVSVATPALASGWFPMRYIAPSPIIPSDGLQTLAGDDLVTYEDELQLITAQ